MPFIRPPLKRENLKYIIKFIENEIYLFINIIYSTTFKMTEPKNKTNSTETC